MLLTIHLLIWFYLITRTCRIYFGYFASIFFYSGLPVTCHHWLFCKHVLLVQCPSKAGLRPRRAVILGTPLLLSIFCTFWSFGPHLRRHLVSVPTHETWGSYDQASISAGRGDVYVRLLRNAWYVVILIIIQYSLEVQLCDAAAAGVGFQKHLYRKTKMSVDVKVLFTAFLPMHSMPSFWRSVPL